MVHYRRNFVPGGTFFFTVALADRRSNTLVDHIDQLRLAFRTTRRERPFNIDAISILPEHLHVIMTLPADDADFSGRWRRLKSLFTRSLIKKGIYVARDSRGEYQLWQKRFWEHTIRNETDFARHMDYIHFNAVKHGLVSQARDWPHSSFHQYVKAGVLPLDRGGPIEDLAGDFGEQDG
jgi:putative transposase